MATEKNPQEVTIRGRLSWPKFTMAEAVAFNATSTYPKSAEKIKPHFNLLLTSDQADKLVAHLRDVFIPWCVAQGKTDAKAKSALTDTQAKKLLRSLDEGDWAEDGITGLINGVPEKSADLAPEAVMSVKVNGFAGQDMPLKAVVKSESDLRNPTNDVIIPERGMIMDVNDTTLELYPGSYVAAQINLFAFVSGKDPGVTASTGAAIFVGHAERFGGGGSLDEDAIFMDD